MNEHSDPPLPSISSALPDVVSSLNRPHGLVERREFLRWSVFVGGGLLFGCSADPNAPADVQDASSSRGDGGYGADTGGAQADVDSTDASGADSPQIDSQSAVMDDAGPPDAQIEPNCTNPLAGAQFSAAIPFVQEGGKVMFQKTGAGWDGRYYTDLRVLDEGKMTMPIGKFYLRTLYPDKLDPKQPWKLLLDGEVAMAKTLTMGDLAPLAIDQGVHLMECSGNGKAGHFGLISAAQWAGVPLSVVLAQVSPTSDGERILIEGFDEHSTPSENGHSKPGASWIFSPEQLADAFLATGMNGEVLPLDHGFPIRLMVPGWYGCCAIKWVTRISYVPDDVPATTQMKEFASRTHQKGVPHLAKNYLPATLDQAAMPIRVERWVKTDGTEVVRLIGVMWGGDSLTDKLTMRIGSAAPVPVKVCPKMSTNATWTLWTHVWEGAGVGGISGTHAITMQISDPLISTRRLDLEWYRRVIDV